MLLLALAITPSFTQEMILEEVGEYQVIVNWEDFLDPGNDNPIIEIEIPPPEGPEEPAGNVDVEVSLGEEGEVSENAEAEGGFVEAEEIEVEVIEIIPIDDNQGFLV